MSNNIPGLEHLAKEGWEIVKFDYASEGEWFVDSEGRVIQCRFSGGTDAKKIIVRKAEKPKTYRPFANAAEFKPYRDRWWRYNDSEDSEHTIPPSSYSKIGPSGSNWQQAFEGRQFDDDSPFGVEVTE